MKYRIVQTYTGHYEVQRGGEDYGETYWLPMTPGMYFDELSQAELWFECFRFPHVVKEYDIE